MYVRDLLCYLDDNVGDGTATAAVLLHAVYRLGLRHLAVGGNAHRWRHFLDQGALLLLRELDTMTWQVTGRKHLARVALSLCYDEPLADVLSKVFDVIGQYGQLEIRADRWHIMDPIRFEEDLRVTIQGRGWRSRRRYLPLQADLASVAYWYQTLPTPPFPQLPDRDYLEII